MRSCFHPATPWSQIALVYPRRAEMQAEMDCLDALKRFGQHLEDGHWFFDIILDEQLSERAADYDVLVLPEIQRLSAAEGERLAGVRPRRRTSGVYGQQRPSRRRWVTARGAAASSSESIASRRIDRRPHGRGDVHSRRSLDSGDGADQGNPARDADFSQARRRYLRSTVSVGAGNSSSAGPGWSPMPPGSCGCGHGVHRMWTRWSFTGSTTSRMRRPQSKYRFRSGRFRQSVKCSTTFR